MTPDKQLLDDFARYVGRVWKAEVQKWADQNLWDGDMPMTDPRKLVEQYLRAKKRLRL